VYVNQLEPIAGGGSKKDNKLLRVDILLPHTIANLFRPASTNTIVTRAQCFGN
jgi:hypothetical protein